jgi:hypothetical protein
MGGNHAPPKLKPWCLKNPFYRQSDLEELEGHRERGVFVAK